jgi:DNA polymerase III alpha subunit
VHLNGTSGENLKAEYRAAIEALVAAQKALPQPNARDFYPQGESVIYAAQEEMKKLHIALQIVIDNLSDIREAIIAQIDARKRRP